MSNIIKRLILSTFVVLFTSISGFAEHELVGLVDKTTGRGVPDARTVFMSIDTPVVSEELDPIWNLEKGNYATGTPVYVESDPAWQLGDAIKSASDVNNAETDPVWESEKGSYLTAETDPIWSADKLSGFSVGGSILPTSSNLYSLGSAEYPWKDVYIGSNTLYLGDGQFRSVSGQLYRAEVVATNIYYFRMNHTNLVSLAPVSYMSEFQWNEDEQRYDFAGSGPDCFIKIVADTNIYPFVYGYESPTQFVTIDIDMTITNSQEYGVSMFWKDANGDEAGCGMYEYYSDVDPVPGNMNILQTMNWPRCPNYYLWSAGDAGPLQISLRIAEGNEGSFRGYISKYDIYTSSIITNWLPVGSVTMETDPVWESEKNEYVTYITTNSIIAGEFLQTENYSELSCIYSNDFATDPSLDNWLLTGGSIWDGSSHIVYSRSGDVQYSNSIYYPAESLIIVTINPASCAGGGGMNFGVYSNSQFISSTASFSCGETGTKTAVVHSTWNRLAISSGGGGSMSWSIDEIKVVAPVSSVITNKVIVNSSGLETDPVWESEKGSYLTAETDPVWESEKGSYLTAETDPVWSGDKLSGFSTPSIFVGDVGTSRGTFHIKSLTDQLVIEDTDGPLDEKYWVVKSDNGIMELITGNDSWNNWSGVLKIYRDGVSVTGLYVNTSIIPEQSNVYDLGSSDNPFATIRAHTFNAVGSSYQIDGQEVLSLNSEGKPLINELYISSGGETGAPLLVESDPGWTSASNLYYLKTQTDSKYITGGTLSVSNPGSYISTEYNFVNQHYTNDAGWQITSGQLRWYTNIGWRATYPTYLGTLTLTNPLGLGVFRLTSVGTRTGAGSSWGINPGNMTWTLNANGAIETNIYTFTNSIATNCLSYYGGAGYGNPTIMTTLLERIYSISQLQSTNEIDPLWTADKPRYATGTPVYVEVDPVWATDKVYYVERLQDAFSTDFTSNPSNDWSFTATCRGGGCGSPDTRPYWNNIDNRISGIGMTFGHEPFPPYNAFDYIAAYTNTLPADDFSSTTLTRFDFTVSDVSIIGAGGYPIGGTLICRVYGSGTTTYSLNSGYNSVLYTGAWSKVDFYCVVDNAFNISYSIDDFRIEKERFIVQGDLLSSGSNTFDVGSQDKPFATIYAHTFNAVGSSYQIDGQEVLSLNEAGKPVIPDLIIVQDGETNTPIINESDPIWISEKSRYATGTPLYVESDPIWSNDKSTGFSVGGSILPDTSNEYDLGSANMPWRDIYVSTGSIHIGSSTLSEKDGNIAINNIPVAYQQINYITNTSIITSNRFITGIDANYYIVNGAYVRWIDYAAPDFYLNMLGCESAGFSTIAVSFVSGEITNSIFYIPWGDMGGGSFSKNITCEWSRINFHIDRETECSAKNTIFYYDDGTNHEFGKYTFRYNYLSTVNGNDEWYFRYMMIEKDIITTSNSAPLYTELDPLWVSDKATGKTIIHEIVDNNGVTSRFSYSSGLLISLQTNGVEKVNP